VGMRISPINMIMDEILPEDLKDPFRVYDSKGVDKLMTEIARRYPEQYPKITKLLGDIGRQQAWRRGETFRLHDFDSPIDRSKYWSQLDQEETAALSDADPASRNERLTALYERLSGDMQKETGQAAMAKRNNIALSVLTGARGKDAQMRDLISSPGFYPDGRGGVVPGFVRNSFAEGLRPYEYLSSSFASRAAVTESKKATAKGGFMAKTLARAMAAEFVSTPDCGTTNGIDMDAGASDLRGRVLQREAGDFKPGSVLDRNTLSKLRNSKATKLIVRSPLTCEAENGVCAKCYGVMAEGRFPKVGDHVGIRAATALGEPVTQAALSLKHVVSGKGGAKEYSGLDYLNQFMESPEEFRERAAVAPVDGHVSDIREAPQGGSVLTIGGEDIYVPLERTIGVKVGEHLEAGEALTDGLVDPEDVLKHRGLGEARRYWAERVGEMAAATNAGMDARQFEMLARGVVDHVELDDPVEDGFLPDDKVRYSRWMHRRPIPASAKQAGIKDAVGRYLEQPASHYTVGTRITPKMAQKLSDGGWKEVFVSDEEPGFSPTFVRLQQVAATDDDWLASLGGSYLGANLQQGVMRAQDTNIESNIHPTPRLAVGVGYAEKLEETGKF
jgi:DNA-directed RNA polymerase subunit beta'